MPPGLAQLAWRAGGAWVLAREALLPRRLVRAALFAVAASFAAWAAWPQPGVGHVADGRSTRSPRCCCWPGCRCWPGGSSGGQSQPGLPIPARLLLYGDPGLAAGLRLPRSVHRPDAGAARVPAHLLYRPGLEQHPGLRRGARQVDRGSDLGGRDPGHAAGHRIRGRHLVPDLAEVPGHPEYAGHRRYRRPAVRRGHVRGGPPRTPEVGHRSVAARIDGRPAGGAGLDPADRRPAAAAVLAARRCRGPDGARPPHNVRIGQGIAAGVLANGTAALFTTALGTGTTMLMLKSPSLLHWLNHGQRLTAVATYRYELYAGNGVGAYVLMLISFPVIGLIMSSLAAAIANPAPRQSSSPPGNGGGPPGPGPEPEPGAPGRWPARGLGPCHCPGVIPAVLFPPTASPGIPGGPTYDLRRVSRVASGPEFSAQTCPCWPRPG